MEFDCWVKGVHTIQLILVMPKLMKRNVRTKVKCGEEAQKETIGAYRYVI